MNATEDLVLHYLTTNADDDGFLFTKGLTIGLALNKPRRTVQSALLRLSNSGKIVQFGRNRYAVVALALASDDLD